MLGPFCVLSAAESEPDYVRNWADRHSGARGVYRLFAIVAEEPGRWVSRERVLDLLWPDSDYVAAESNFYSALRHLRQRLAAASASARDWIQCRGGLYRLKSEVADGVDVFRFRALADRALQHPQDSIEAIDLYRQMLDLYGGPFLEDARVAVWIHAARLRLEELAVRATVAIADSEIRDGAFAPAEERIWKALAWRPDDPSLIRLIDHLYAVSGRRFARQRAQSALGLK